MKFWSEVRASRVWEMTGDAATLLWTVLWVAVGWKLYAVLAPLARAGEALQDAGMGLQAAGEQLGDTLGRVPVIGRAGDWVRVAFDAAGGPFLAVGTDLKRFLILVAVVLAVVVACVPIVLWWHRYLPWRLGRIRTLSAADRVIRRAGAPAAEVQRWLASRALHRLSYAELLEHSPDPFGDWSAGRFDRLARAELESVGLRPAPLRPESTLAASNA